MWRLVFILAIVGLFIYGVSQGVVTFGLSRKPQEMCQKACAPKSVVRLSTRIDLQGEVQGYDCECGL